MEQKTLPWSERVAMLAFYPDAATRGDIARLATELMQLRQIVLKFKEIIEDTID